MLVMVTMFWGVSYFMIDLSLTEMGTFTLNMYRFMGAFVVAAAFSFPKLKNVSRTTLKYSFYLGIILFFTYTSATYGVKHTSLSNAGFLCGLAVLFTPLLAYVFKKVVPGKKIGIAVAMCITGTALLTLNEGFSLAWGDILCILCSAVYAVQMLVTETAVRKPDVDAFHLGVFQLMFMGIFCTVFAFAFEKPQLPSEGKVWISVIFLSLFCTGLAFIIQSIAQQYTSATRVGLIFTLEPVFAGFVAYFLAGEILEPKAYLGAAIIVASLFLAEVDVKKIIKKT